MHSCNQCGTTFTRKSNLTRHKNSRCKPASIITSGGTIEPTFVAATVKELFHEPRPKNPKIQDLLDEIINGDDPDRNVTPPQAIHKGFFYRTSYHNITFFEAVETVNTRVTVHSNDERRTCYEGNKTITTC